MQHREPHKTIVHQWNLKVYHIIELEISVSHNLAKLGGSPEGIGVRARGARGAAAPPKFWATQIFWAVRENLGKASFLRLFRVF